MPTWLHDGAAGVEIRRPGEPCSHRHRVSYTDESGLYSRCAVCGAQLSPKPAENEVEGLVGEPQPRPANPPARRRIVEGCDYCARYAHESMVPPHDASRRCESGGYSHCSCGRCF